MWSVQLRSKVLDNLQLNDKVTIAEGSLRSTSLPLTTWFLQTERTTDCTTGACLDYHLLLLGIRESIAPLVILKLRRTVYTFTYWKTMMNASYLSHNFCSCPGRSDASMERTTKTLGEFRVWQKHLRGAISSVIRLYVFLILILTIWVRSTRHPKIDEQIFIIQKECNCHGHDLISKFIESLFLENHWPCTSLFSTNANLICFNLTSNNI